MTYHVSSLSRACPCMTYDGLLLPRWQERDFVMAPLADLLMWRDVQAGALTLPPTPPSSPAGDAVHTPSSSSSLAGVVGRDSGVSAAAAAAALATSRVGGSSPLLSAPGATGTDEGGGDAAGAGQAGSSGGCSGSSGPASHLVYPQLLKAARLWQKLQPGPPGPGTNRPWPGAHAPTPHTHPAAPPSDAAEGTRSGDGSSGGSSAVQMRTVTPLPGGRLWEWGRLTRVMGVLNVTPDSFSDGGRHVDLQQAVAAALRMAEEGVHVIDVGGQSTRPGATLLPPGEELARVMPVIR